MPPSVSVVIATFNRGSRIRRTLESVLTQSASTSEIVVIDDGSTDGTASWIRSQYPAVTVLTTKNGGTSTARNRGAVAATGDILVFLDHDDEMLPHAIQTLRDLLTRFPTTRAAYADHTYQDFGTGEFLPNHHSVNPAFARMHAIPTVAADGDARVYGRPMYYALLKGNLLQQPWAIYKSTFVDLGGFDTGIKYCEDWEMYMRVTNAHPVAVTDTVIAHHYIEGENLHRAAGQEAQHMRVLRKHIGRTR